MLWFLVGVGVLIGIVWGLAKSTKHDDGLPALSGQIIVSGDGDYDFNVVGESNYQHALEAIAGRSDESAEYYCTAQLIPEPTNEYDKRAIRVDIDGRPVGYIPRDETSDFHNILNGRSASVDAVIVGGWVRGRRGDGHFGVKLDVAYPLRLQ
ncbi:HIRAN domain-containing protein [Ochrobactrum sp. Marseille-Q0166]|uniref:HIRAN domain-containing protein n=1 Tax=Ochrobactrum sp. Marseille-Q0166 TaxID=2761105 RepID=UPI00165597ED|nr:HIRAN domain-containing protein [Ochrobactrum sp. Marseille-Q0166]MBC8719309.1 HIRAN domain-containing protein [Ochrobactrum sp. Marseille-Q0166]